MVDGGTPDFQDVEVGDASLLDQPIQAETLGEQIPAQTQIDTGQTPSGLSRGQLLGLNVIRDFVDKLRGRSNDFTQNDEQSVTSSPDSSQASISLSNGKPAQTESTPNSITRRALIQRAMLAGFAFTQAGRAVRYLDDAYKNIGRSLAEFTDNPDRMQLLIKSLSEALRFSSCREVQETYGVELEDNPDYRPMLEIIQEAVEAYSAQGNQVEFGFHPDRQTDEHYANLINEWVSCIKIDDVKGVLAGDPDTVAKVGEIKKHLMHAVDKDVILTAASFSQYDYGELRYEPDSTLGRQVREIEMYAGGLPLRQLRQVAGIDNSTLSRERVTGELVRLQISEQILSVYHEVLASAEPESISASTILVKFLEHNHGHLSRAIVDTGIFLELMARNDLETGAFLPDVDRGRFPEVVERFRSLRDEYSVIGRHFSTETARRLSLGVDPAYKDLSPINLVGSPYHVWQIVGLLYSFPPGLIQRAVLATQLFEFNPLENGEPPRNQGSLKTLTDLRVLEDLYVLNRYLSGEQMAGAPKS